MDTITHALSGAVVARTGLGRSLGKGPGGAGAVAIFVGALLPDIDHFPLIFFGWEGYLKHHRGFTHSALGSLVLALVLALAIKVYYGRKERERPMPVSGLFLLSLLAIWLHIFLDLITSFGTMLLYPFSLKRFSLDLVFIIDLYVSAIFFLPLLLGWIINNHRERLARGFLLLFSLYLLLAWQNHSTALNRAETEARGVNPPRELIRAEAYPAPLSPFNWMVVSETSDVFYLYRDILRGGPIESFEKNLSDPFIEAASAVGSVRTYLWFADFPLARSFATPEGQRVEFFDLRFYSLPPRRPFLLKVDFDSGGTLKGVTLD